MKFKIEVKDYEVFPAWYYGFAYREGHRIVSIFMIMPFNFFYRWVRHIQYAWNKFRGTGSIIDKLIMEEKNKSWNEGKEYAERMINERADYIATKLDKITEMLDK